MADKLELLVVKETNTPKRLLKENTKKEACVVGFPYGSTSLGLLASEQLPFNDFVFQLNNNDKDHKEHITQITNISIHNFGTAFVTVFGLNQSHKDLYLNTRKQFEESKKTIQHQEEWQDLQVKMSRQWYCILPETQLLTLNQYSNQQPGKYDRLREWKLGVYDQFWNFSHGPYELLIVRCRPFFELCRTIIVKKGDKKADKKSDKKKSNELKGISAATIGLFYVSVHGVTKKCDCKSDIVVLPKLFTSESTFSTLSKHSAPPLDDDDVDMAKISSSVFDF